MMAITLEDLAARVEELAREKESSEQKVAAMEQELVALRAALTGRPLESSDVPGAYASSPRSADEAQGQHGPVRRTLPRPITRLGLIGAAAAAGAYAVMPAGAHAETQVTPQAPITSPNGLFSLNVTDAGIFLTGPTGRIEVLLGQVIVHSAGVTKIEGGQVRLNSGGKPVARVGDTVQVTTINSPATGTILPPGAVTVLA